MNTQETGKEDGAAAPARTGTFAYEGTLPKVPLPRLDVTIARFLDWCTPLLSLEERATTRKAVYAFTKPGGLGEQLYAALKAHYDDSATVSWLDRFWATRYLGRRDCIALNANFFFLFQHTGLTRAARAAAIAAAGLNFKLSLDSELLPPMMSRDKPLDMNQLRYLFSATRIPGETQDTLRSFYSLEQPGPSTARHILVYYRNQPFALDVVSAAGIAHSRKDIEAGINEILETLDTIEAPRAVGHLTTQRRADWARTRKELIAASPVNAANIDKIETALFVINLEDEAPATDLAACDHLLHGESGNRWFDKALQLIVFENGMAGINIEHCALDGTTILNFVDYILGVDPNTIDQYSGAESQGTPKIERLVFELDAPMQKVIATAAETFNKLKTTTVTRTFDFPDFGAEHIKKLKMSPDAFAQCSMQLAQRRTKGFTGATYESIATRQFEHGRTEAMRTITPEAIAFVDAMLDPSQSFEQQIAAFRLAADKHTERARDCQLHEAPEQVLWELLNVYNRDPQKYEADFLTRWRKGGLSAKDIEEALSLYKSPGWIKMRSDALSTSSAPSPSIRYFGFGSTGPGCIGVGYLVRANEINSYLSTAQGEGETLDRFIVEWERAIRELGALLQRDPKLQPAG
jgi:carnitine O-acetyltransferase